MTWRVLHLGVPRCGTLDEMVIRSVVRRMEDLAARLLPGATVYDLGWDGEEEPCRACWAQSMADGGMCDDCWESMFDDPAGGAA